MHSSAGIETCVMTGSMLVAGTRNCQVSAMQISIAQDTALSSANIPTAVFRITVSVLLPIQRLCRCGYAEWKDGVLRVTVSVLVLIEGLSQLHVLVHEDDGEDFPRPVCLIALRLVEVQAGVETHLTYTACRIAAML